MHSCLVPIWIEQHIFKEVYETIVNRDLVQKYNLPDTQVLRQLSEFLMDNISNLTSPNKISDILKAHDVAIQSCDHRKIY